MYVGIHCGWSTHVRSRTTLHSVIDFGPRNRTVTESSSPTSNRLINKQPDIRRNLYVLGLPFDLVKYVWALTYTYTHRSRRYKGRICGNIC